MFPVKFKNILFEEITSYGGAMLYLFAVVLGFTYSKYLFILQLLLGFILIYFSGIIIRSFYFKERPEKRDFQSLIGKLDASSFPSLHSARAVFFTFMMKDLFQNVYLFYFLIIMAVMVGYSRIYLKKHYLADVLGGFALGILIYLLTNLI